MASGIVELILQDRRIAYAITDRDLNVVEVHGAADILLPQPYGGPVSASGAAPAGHACVGRSLLELVPELMGCEDVLADILGGTLPRFELAWINRKTTEGEMRYLNLVTFPNHDGAGQITGVVHLMQDVTEMGTIDQQLAQSRNELRLLRDQLARQNLELAAANAELRRMDEIKSTFVSMAAHELRSPLMAILGYVEMLLDGEFGPLADDQRARLAIVQGSAESLLPTADTLLDLARIEAGRVELVLQPRDLAALVERVAAEFEPRLRARAQQLTLRAAPDLPPALCDEARAAQIIGNLLSNASKYTPRSGRIRISLAPAEEEGFLRVSVADTGVGIAAEEHDKLFRRFFRAGSAQRTRARGAGLGLYIARSLVEQHGGRIWFESEPDRGSIFHVTFPAAWEPD